MSKGTQLIPRVVDENHVKGDDKRAMNISSSVNASQLSNADPQGAAARQDYGVAIATKIKDQIKQEGAAIEQLTESAAAPDLDDKTGKNLSTYA